MRLHLPHLGDLQVLETYVYYDGPRLFAARSATGRLFLAVWTGEDDHGESWLYLPLSRSRLRELKSGRLMLGAAFRAPEGGLLWRVTTPHDDREPPTSRPVHPSRVPDADLPEDVPLAAPAVG